MVSVKSAQVATWEPLMLTDFTTEPKTEAQTLTPAGKPTKTIVPVDLT